MSPNGEMIDKVASIVLAGGEGTRLFPLTHSRSKPAVGFGGRYRLIDVPISNSLNSKIQQIYIISQYFASDLHQHVLGSFPFELFQRGDLKLLSPEETPKGKAWYKGTADAVRKNIGHLLKSSAEYFLILSGDQLYNTPFIPMLHFARDTDADLVIAALPVGEPEAKRMGLLKTKSSGRVEDFYEKPQAPDLLKRFQLNRDSGVPHYLGSMGIYIFKRAALASLLQEEGDDFGKHLIPTQIKRGKTFAYEFDGYWEDIGTVSSYYKANLALLKPTGSFDIHDETRPIYTTRHLLPSPLIRNTFIRNSIISQGAIIDAKEIVESVVGVRSQIRKGTIIHDSIVMGHKFYQPPPHLTPPLPSQFSIGEECELRKTIIDEHSCLGNGVKLLNKQHLQTFDGDGVYIRDGIIIVTSGTNLPDGFEI
ncbi:MAG: sugar phosphate nucleotidyltransferase [Chlamydiales bacterium]